MKFGYASSLFLLLAFAWHQVAMSFSPASLPQSASSLSTGKSRTVQPQYFDGPISSASAPIHRKLQSTKLQMSTTDDDSSSDNDPTESSSVSEGQKLEKLDTKVNNKQRSNFILIIPLFCKFMVVMAIKVLTDAVVFPSLYIYRQLRKVKRGIFTFFGKLTFGTMPSSVKPNGSSK
mmetsp:Transcript_25849/g.56903  ORF Transcript_25849/g.56903 Transcript_25849/m.56903 type:complete len:176 (+) Transcript_25849:115-642(+)